MQRGAVAPRRAAQCPIEGERLRKPFNPLLGRRGLEQRLLLGARQLQRLADLAGKAPELELLDAREIELASSAGIAEQLAQLAYDFVALRSRARFVAELFPNSSTLPMR